MKKKKISVILGVALTVMLVASLMVAAVPVSAAKDACEWNKIAGPCLGTDMHIVDLAVAPDGTIFASVMEWVDDGDGIPEPGDTTFVIKKSADGGHTWKDTTLKAIDDVLIDIVVSDNYTEDKTVYVASIGVGHGLWEEWDDSTVYVPRVYRLEQAGAANYKILKPIPIDAEGDATESLYSIDVWYDGTVSWILAGTDQDVWVLDDTSFGFWVDQELDKGVGVGEPPAVKVVFAPDFDDSTIMWALTYNGIVTATIAPGLWGQWIGDAELINVDGDNLDDVLWGDFGFGEDYTSDVEDGVPAFFVGCTDGDDTGNLFIIEGVAAEVPYGTANSFYAPLRDDENILSLAVSGGGTVVLGGLHDTAGVIRSSTGGASFDTIRKQPTGEEWTSVAMAPGAFDPDTGIAYAGTIGGESAVNVSHDGGITWNQTCYVNTCITEIVDLAFHPDFVNTPTLLLLTYCDDSEAYSLWRSDDGDQAAPKWERVWTSTIAAASGAPDPAEFYLVEFALDMSTVYLHGYDGIKSVLWRSSDMGQTFSGKRSVKDGTYDINDWVIPSASTIYAATDKGFLRSVNAGLSWKEALAGTELNHIAYWDTTTILVGGIAGNAYFSSTSGASFADIDLGLSGSVWVAFDALYDENFLVYAATNSGLDNVMVGDIEDFDNAVWKSLKDDADEATFTPEASGLEVSPDNTLYVATSPMGGLTAHTYVGGTLVVEGCLSGEVCIDTISDTTTVSLISGSFIEGEVVATTSTAIVAEDVDEVVGTITVKGNISHALGIITVTLDCATSDFELDETCKVINTALTVTDVSGGLVGQPDGVARLLLHEDASVWELDGTPLELSGLYDLWLTLDTSNFLWTVVSSMSSADFYSFEDNLFDQLALASPADATALDRLHQVTMKWNTLGCADEYGYEYDSNSGTTTGTSKTVTDLATGTTYDWRARVTSPLHSRWSGKWAYTTALGPPEWAPTQSAPAQGATNVALSPTFSWTQADWATGYEFILATDYYFANTIMTKTVLNTVYRYAEVLDYNTPYYWKVRAVSDNAHSHWSDGCVFTTIPEPAAPPPPPEPPAPCPPTQVNVDVPPAQVEVQQVMPSYVYWLIIGIGAALLIVVIVLIVRTRRAV